ncbi:MAG: hypothetical protein D6791_17360 [Chloroflexi bacterium]|nr:MAG: hypothetical protein D6791_17360 [Chloroflexota bacterium]
MSADTFDILFLIARPAAGKSEIIHFLKHVALQERRRRFHIGAFTELDDFPMIWTWFEEDALLEEMGKPRLHTDEQGLFLYPYLWHLLIRRLALEYKKLRRDEQDGEERKTAIVEFARGSEHGGFREAFAHFPEEMLRRGAVLYINVSWEESKRKNRRRFNPERPDSILEHSLPDWKLELLYRDSDWDEFSAGDPAYLAINGVRVPYAVFENEDDVTTGPSPELAPRLEAALELLWQRYLQRPSS